MDANVFFLGFGRLLGIFSELHAVRERAGCIFWFKKEKKKEGGTVKIED